MPRTPSVPNRRESEELFDTGDPDLGGRGLDPGDAGISDRIRVNVQLILAGAEPAHVHVDKNVVRLDAGKLVASTTERDVDGTRASLRRQIRRDLSQMNGPVAERALVRSRGNLHGDGCRARVLQPQHRIDQAEPYELADGCAGATDGNRFRHRFRDVLDGTLRADDIDD